MNCSVVLPYYENQRTLAACLRSFAAQTVKPLEIIVVDDGSAEAAAPLVATQEVGPVPIHCLSAEHAGQSAATNLGIQRAQGEVVLLTCADIIAHSALVEHHLQAHEKSAVPLAVLGNIPYASHVTMTPFLHYLSQPGPQFCFAWISDPENVSPKYCYSPNLSVQRDALLRVGMFDAGFKYGYQDTDLGMRLHAAGTRLVYRDAAIAYHDHPTDVRRFVQRQRTLADGTLSMLEKYPDADNVARLRGMVQHYQRYVGRLPKMLGDIEARELQLTRSLTPAVRQQLHQLYDFVLTLALVDGILQQPERAQQILHLSP